MGSIWAVFQPNPWLFSPKAPPHPQKQEHMVLRRVSKFFSEKKHQAGEPGGSLDPANYLFSDLGDQLAGRKTIKYNDIFLFKFWFMTS